MIKNILFDFDGTIADTASGIIATMAETFRCVGLPVPSDESMRQTIGIPLFKALQGLNDLSDDEAKHAVEVYSQLFREIELHYTTIYRGVADTLQQLKDKGIRMAIVTSRNRESLVLILERYDLLKYFEVLFTNDERMTIHPDRQPSTVLRPKPAPDMTIALMNMMGIEAAETIVIGDTTFDIEMGNAAHCTTCAVTYGNHTRQQLETVSPSYVIDDFTELLSLI